MPVDFSQLKFTIVSPEEPDFDGDYGELEDSDYEDEFGFTKEYRVSVADPNAPESPQTETGYPSEPQPLVEILVRTIEREIIPPGEFHSYMDNLCEDFLQFSVAVFTNSGLIKKSLMRRDSPDRGTGVWGKEINHGRLAYIENLRVKPEYQRQGVGRWAIESLLNSKELADCPFFFTWATGLNTASFFGPPEPESEMKSKEARSIDFFRAVGFRRVGGTWFFGYARDPQHPMRSLRAEDDAGVTQVTAATIYDTFEIGQL